MLCIISATCVSYGNGAGADIVGRLLADEGAALCGILRREQRFHRYLGEIGITVIGFTIRECELHRLGTQ